MSPTSRSHDELIAARCIDHAPLIVRDAIDLPKWGTTRDMYTVRMCINCLFRLRLFKFPLEVRFDTRISAKETDFFDKKYREQHTHTAKCRATGAIMWRQYRNIPNCCQVFFQLGAGSSFIYESVAASCPLVPSTSLGACFARGTRLRGPASGERLLPSRLVDASLGNCVNP